MFVLVKRGDSKFAKERISIVRAAPLPRPNHPFMVPCGWLGRGSGAARTIRNASFGSDTKRTHGQAQNPLCLRRLRQHHATLAGAMSRLRRVEHAGRGCAADDLLVEA